MRRAAIALAALLLAPGCEVPPVARGSQRASDHFDGARYFNPDGRNDAPGAQKGRSIIRQALFNTDSSWPRSVPIARSRPPARVPGRDMLVTWVGHSSVLVQTQGLNILTDPVWSDRASPVQFAGIRRVRAPGVAFDDLPPIDLVLVSHDHYDHLDTATLRKLWKRDRPRIVVALGNERLLARYGVPATARDWGGRVTVRPGIDAIVERAHHWSRRGLGDRDRALWCGFTVTLPGGNLYYAGDTGPGDMRWGPEARAHGPVRLALLPIGAYHFDGHPTDNHIGPDDAVRVFGQIGAAYALGVHWGTFELTNEGLNQPRDRLAVAAAAARIAPGRFRTTEAGEAWKVPER